MLEPVEGARGDGDVAGETDGGVSVGELLLAAGDRFGLALSPGGLDEAHAATQLAVCDVARARCLDLANGLQRGDRLDRDRDRPHHPRAGGGEEGGADVDTRPARDPVGRVNGAVRPVRVPRLSAPSGHAAASSMPSRSGSAAARPRPGRDQGRTPRGSRSRPCRAKRAHDADVRGGEALCERFDLAQEDRARSGVRSLLSTHALDGTPRAWRRSAQTRRARDRASRPGPYVSSRYDRMASESSGTTSRAHASPR